MKLTAYIEESARTAGTFESPRLALAYWTLGLVGEAQEYEEAIRGWANLSPSLKSETKKEAGDVMWYVAAFIREIHQQTGIMLDFSFYSHGDETALIEAAKLAEHVKKHLGHGRPLDLMFIKITLGRIMAVIHEQAEREGHKLGDILDANITKLRIRFPTGFNHADSAARRDTREG